MTDYSSLFTDYIKAQMQMLGPSIALEKAELVAGIKVGDSGSAVIISGEPIELLDNLVAEYKKLSGNVAVLILETVLEKHPNLADGIQKHLKRND